MDSIIVGQQKHKRAVFNTCRLLLLLISVTLSANANAVPLRWCLDHYPGRHVFNGENISGPSVDFMRELAERSQLNLVHSEDTPFARCLKQLHDGDMDVMIGLYKTNERSRYMHMFPIYTGMTEKLYYHKDKQAPITKLDQLVDFHIVIREKFNIHTPDYEYILQHNTISETKTVSDAMAMLLTGHADFVLATSFSADFSLQNNPRLDAAIEVSPVQLARDNQTLIYLGVSKNSKLPPDSIRRVEQSLIEMRAQGKSNIFISP